MKNRILILLALCLGLPVWAQHSLTLMTYNIRNGKGMDGVRNVQRIANVILKAAPDVVAVQEVDSMTRRSGGTYVLGEVAERVQMNAYFAPAIDYDGGKYGIGILAKQKPLRLQRVPLPGSEEKRALLLAEFDDYIFCSTHLSLTEEDRMRSLEIIYHLYGSSEKPCFLAGDLNALPDSPFISELKKKFNVLTYPDRPTYPAPKPTETIDYIAAWKLSSDVFALQSAWVLNEPMASDHRPIRVVLRMAEKQERIFRMKPYLQNPTNQGMTVMWETNVPAYSWVEYGTDTLQLQMARHLVDGQVICNNTLHKVRLEGLQPGQKYYYRVCSQEILLYQAYKKIFGNIARSSFSEFTVPETKQDHFTALIFNDLHQRKLVFKALCRQVADVKADFVVFNGDCIDDPAGREQVTSFISTLSQGVKGDRVPMFFVRGNHEIRNAYSIGLRDHLDYVGDKTYGAFSWGDTRVVLLDCGEDKRDSHWVYYGLNDFTHLRAEQVDFIKKELASKAFKKAKKRVLVHHIPLYGEYSHKTCAKLWAPLLNKGRFHLAINGHTHQYAFHPAHELGNAYPVVVGGGNDLKSATVMILEKKQSELRVRVLNAKGDVLLDRAF